MLSEAAKLRSWLSVREQRRRFPSVKCIELVAFISEPLVTSERCGPENSYSLLILE
jgi:hypothetical protein